MATSFQDLIPPSTSQSGIVPPTSLKVSDELVPSTSAQADIPAPPPATPPAPLTPTAPSSAANVSTAVNQAPAENLGVARESTTQGQMEDLLGKESMYLRSARESGVQYGAERGLLNSSIAGQAGEQAAINAALPIAQSDAATYAAQAGQRQDHLNRLREAAASGDTQAQLNYQNAVAQSKLQDQAHQAQLVELSHQGKISSALQAQNHLERMAEAARQGDIQAILQLQAAGYDSQLSAQENLQKLEQQALAGDIDSTLALQQFNYSSLLEELTQGNRIELDNVQFQHQLGILGTQLQNSKVLNDQEATIWIGQQNQLHQQTLDQIDAQAEAQIRVAGANVTAEQRRDIQQQTAQLHGQYLASVSQLQLSASNEIANIYSQQGLTAAQQTNAVAEVMQRVASNVSALGAQYAASPFWDTNWTQGGASTDGTAQIPTPPTQGPSTQGVDLIPPPPAYGAPVTGTAAPPAYPAPAAATPAARQPYEDIAPEELKTLISRANSTLGGIGNIGAKYAAITRLHELGYPGF